MLDRWAVGGLAWMVLVVGCGEPAAMTAGPYQDGVRHRRTPDAGADASADATGQGGAPHDGGRTGAGGTGEGGRGQDAGDGGEAPAPTNPISLENALPGTSEWAIAQPSPNHEIEAY